MFISRTIFGSMAPRLFSQHAAAAARQYSTMITASNLLPAAVVPALRQFGLHNTINTSMFAATAATRRWTMRTMATGTDAQLIKVIGAEESFEKENYEQPEALKTPPGGWTLEETPENTLMTLSKANGKETIKVEIMVTNQPDEEEMTYEDEESGELETDLGVTFNVCVNKGGDDSIVFECRSDGTYLSVVHVSLEPASGDYEDSLYTGPVYPELDEELRSALEGYLEARGITLELGAYLTQLVNDREQREYMGWLGRMKQFVSQ